MEPLKYRSTTIRPATILTTSYVAATVIGNDTENTNILYTDNQFILYLDVIALGNMTSVEYKFEFSDDATTWYQECFGAISGGTETDTLGEHTVTAAGNYRIPVQLKDRYCRVSFKGTGGDGTGSSASAIAIYGTA